MQNSKPQKILGKKFVRGKPYYKIKWQGSGKQLATWQSPIRLKQFKSMINKYEMKNWGSPLDEKFFDSSLYEAKNTHPRKKPQQKKSIKAAKKMQKSKMQQMSSRSELSEQKHGNSQQQQERDQQQIKLPRSEIEEQPLSKKIASKNREQSAPIIDLQILEAEIEKPKEALQKQSLTKQAITDKIQQKNYLNPGGLERIDATPQKNGKKSNEINIGQLDNKKDRTDRAEPQTNQVEYYKDLGLELNRSKGQKQKQVSIIHVQESEKTRKQLSLTNTLSLQIDRSLWVTRIAHIYHLERVNAGNHLYLVEFNDKEMRKMATKELLEKYPNELINFLEGRYKAKHLLGLI